MANNNNNGVNGASDMVNKVGDRAKEGVDKARTAAQKELARLKQHTDKAMKQAEEYIKKNPEKATVIAAGVGAALGAAVAILLGKKRK